MSQPAIALIVGFAALALAAALFWPQRGLAMRWLALLRRTERVLLEDALKHLYDEEYHDRAGSLSGLAGALGIQASRAAALVERLETLRLVTSAGDRIALTDDGRANALRVVRIHRLWERYLADHSGLDDTEWHPRAEQLEHTTTLAQADALARSMGHPRFDPHGDPIPTAEGEIAPQRGQALNTLDAGDHGTVVHVEDEPAAVYAQLVAAGVRPGMPVRVLEAGRERMRIGLDGDECLLAPVVAGNVTVVKDNDPVDEALAADRLSVLAPGESATVVDISRACRGQQRRRLLDLGLVPGTEVTAELAAPSGDPVAFRIRGAAIALRREQADLVHIARGKAS
jgi:DtxR family Mn-dependent transcriptional regulator